RDARGVVTAHSVNAASRRSRRRTEIKSLNRCAIRRSAQNGSCNQLHDIRRAAVNIAASQIRIRFLQIGSAHFVTSDNAIAKTGRESFNLRFNAVRHVALAIEWNLAVDPEGMSAARCPRFIKQTLLRDQHKRPLRNFSLRDVAFSGCDFTNGAAEMN